MSAQHTPGMQCVECEGFCLVAEKVGVAAIALQIGQHVRHRDHKGQRVTGTVRGIGIEDRALMATITLDRPIVIPARDGFRQIDIHTQHVPAHELTPFDARDELIADLLASLEEARTGLLWYRDRNPGQSDGSDDEAMARIEAAIAKATGSAP